jgi:hypothetical protein
VVPEGTAPAEAAAVMVAAILAMVLRNEALFRAYLAEALWRRCADGWRSQPLNGWCRGFRCSRGSKR